MYELDLLNHIFFKHRGLAIVFSVAALVLIMIVLMNVSIAGQGSK